MKGNNKLNVCQAAMIDMVQEWVDKNIASKPEVLSVKKNIHNRGQTDQFDIILSDRPTIKEE